MLRKRIARENSVSAIEGHFDDFVDHVLRVRQILQYESKQFSLQHGQYLRDNDHRKSRASFVTNVKSSSMIRGIRSQSVSPLSPSQFTWKQSWAVRLSHGHERRVKAFIDKKLHEVDPDGLETFSFRRLRCFTDFTFRPCSESFLGRPLAGWAATQISASSTIRSVSEG